MQQSCVRSGLIRLCAHCADGFFWYLYQDASIQHEVKLTGILSTNGLSQGEGPQPDYGVLMAPGLNAQIHQHFFNVRMDVAVDDDNGGANLTAVEVRTALNTSTWPMVHDYVDVC
jgi:Cu2+-containing amine oxidase